jgi:hypothetical protein
MAGWLFVVVSWTALLSPPWIETEGIATNFTLPVLFGAITAVYYLTLIPMLILPVPDDQRFEWFFCSALSWVLCLMATLGALTLRGVIGYADVDLPMGPRGMAGIVACLFITAMLLLQFAKVENRQRLYALGTLLAGWFCLQGTLLLILQVGGRIELPVILSEPFRGMQQLGLLMLSLLWIFLVCGVTLPPAEHRRDVLGFLLLSWLFFVAAILCYQMTHGNITILGGNGWEVFICLVISVFIAPFASWLGVPGLRGRRKEWITCLLLATVVVLLGASWIRFPGGDENLLRHVWMRYDGVSLNL